MALSGAVPKAILKRRVRLEKRSFWLVEGWSNKGGPLAALVGYPSGQSWSKVYCQGQQVSLSRVTSDFALPLLVKTQGALGEGRAVLSLPRPPFFHLIFHLFDPIFHAMLGGNMRIQTLTVGRRKEMMR